MAEFTISARRHLLFHSESPLLTSRGLKILACPGAIETGQNKVDHFAFFFLSSIFLGLLERLDDVIVLKRLPNCRCLSVNVFRYNKLLRYIQNVLINYQPTLFSYPTFFVLKPLLTFCVDATLRLLCGNTIRLTICSFYKRNWWLFHLFFFNLYDFFF